MKSRDERMRFLEISFYLEIFRDEIDYISLSR